MNLSTIKVNSADPRSLASLAFEALSSDLGSSRIREILAEIEFAKNTDVKPILRILSRNSL